MNSQDPGQKPEPQAESGELNPGGADAVHNASADGVERSDAVPADLDPNQNPAVEDVMPDEVFEGEDTETKATRNDDDVEPDEESPA